MSLSVKTESSQSITLDGSNKVTFPSFPYTFEALNEKVLVALDQFKSGYECKTCEGKGEVKVECACIITGRPGLKYTEEHLQDIAQALGSDISHTRAIELCPFCKGDPASVRKTQTCPDCQGKTALLVIPDSAKIIACSGVVVSMGAKAREQAGYKIGDRILFSQHAGSLIPTRSGIHFKQLDWYQAWVRIEGADDLATFDFIVSTEEFS